jgi:hypothetical protein
MSRISPALKFWIAGRNQMVARSDPREMLEVHRNPLVILLTALSAISFTGGARAWLIHEVSKSQSGMSVRPAEKVLR